VSVRYALGWVLFVVVVVYTVWQVRDSRRDRLHGPRVRRAWWRLAGAVVLTVLAAANVVANVVLG